MKNNLELHIFTNSTDLSPSIKLIKDTYDSFIQCFKIEIDPIIWLDPKPNVTEAEKYKKKLLKIFKHLNYSESLSDGYIKAVNSSKANFLFMLEHDWLFSEIPNSLNEILEIMQEDEIMHLRFNQRANMVEKSDKYLIEKKSRLFKYCQTPSLSNNPHIINRKLYKKNALPFLKAGIGSSGIEGVLNGIENLEGSIYGGVNNPKVIFHTNGRREVRKPIDVLKNKIKSTLKRM